jgi:hypothetical protein
MREITQPKTSFIVELTKEELEYIRNLSQNYQGNPENESNIEKKIRMNLFVGSSRLLGFDMNDDGSIKR